MEAIRLADSMDDTSAGSPEGGQRGSRGERRKDVRAALDAPIWLRVLEATGAPVEGRIVNISKRGMKLRLPVALQPGVGVQARMGGKIIMAEVRYCLPQGGEFHVGIEIQDVFPIPGASAGE